MVFSSQIIWESTMSTKARPTMLLPWGLVHRFRLETPCKNSSLYSPSQTPLDVHVLATRTIQSYPLRACGKGKNPKGK